MKKQPVYLQKERFEELKNSFSRFVSAPSYSNWLFLLIQIHDVQPSHKFDTIIEKENSLPIEMDSEWTLLREFAKKIGDTNSGNCIQRYLDRIRSTWVRKANNRIYIHPDKAWEDLMKSKIFKTKVKAGEWSYSPKDQSCKKC